MLYSDKLQKIAKMHEDWVEEFTDSVDPKQFRQYADKKKTAADEAPLDIAPSAEAAAAYQERLTEILNESGEQ